MYWHPHLWPMTVPAPIDVRERQWCVILTGKIHSHSVALPTRVTISRSTLPFSWRDMSPPDEFRLLGRRERPSYVCGEGWGESNSRHAKVPTIASPIDVGQEMHPSVKYHG